MAGGLESLESGECEKKTQRFFFFFAGLAVFLAFALGLAFAFAFLAGLAAFLAGAFLAAAFFAAIVVVPPFEVGWCEAATAPRRRCHPARQTRACGAFASLPALIIGAQKKGAGRKGRTLRWRSRISSGPTYVGHTYPTRRMGRS